MPTTKLTKRSVESFQPQGKEIIIWDTEIKGFACRVHPSGKRTYCLYYRTHAGQQRRPATGTHGTITVDEARRIALQWSAVVSKGGDPSGERLEAQHQPTFEQFAESYLEYSRHHLARKTFD